MARYHCAACGLAVIVLPDSDPIRPCGCDGPIIAEAVAALAGVGGITP